MLLCSSVAGRSVLDDDDLETIESARGENRPDRFELGMAGSTSDEWLSPRSSTIPVASVGSSHMLMPESIEGRLLWPLMLLGKFSSGRGDFSSITMFSSISKSVVCLFVTVACDTMRGWAVAISRKKRLMTAAVWRLGSGVDRPLIEEGAWKRCGCVDRPWLRAFSTAAMLWVCRGR